ncbi:MAG: 16S rRNA (cytosine(1402)-N(4))-methyltransferase RsmH [Prevotellaceae bacterium]|jgi:16S rRNA (cytosine1402-N4)-methyltransferase|nr:16S rRNA (cytosine(1402)-N(4))-methyltransferase RsmH [Prevotellaceae bacterium]
MSEFLPYHVPALLAECVEALAVKASGTYVDLTFGGGGHAREILQRLGVKGRLLAFDQDADAEANAALIGDKRLTLVRGNFRFLRSYLRYHKAGEVDGILGDLGVSWHQFDTAERGFSFRFDAALDMRMNSCGERTAIDVINGSTVADLSRILSVYGELPNARKLAAMVEQARRDKPITTAGELVEALRPALPKIDEHKVLAKIFQALRIEVNREMQALEQMLAQTAKVIKRGGRIAIISYHSLEDRMVKNFIRCGNVHGEQSKDLFGNVSVPFVAVNRKVITPGEAEIAGNTRARSAKLRVAEKI